MYKKIYKTVFTVEVLSEEPIESTSLYELAEETTNGSWSGILELTSSTELTGNEAVVEIRKQGSDESFFNIDEEGKDLDYENE